MNVLTFLAKNWDSVLVVVAFLAVVVVLIKRGETKILILKYFVRTGKTL